MCLAWPAERKKRILSVEVIVKTGIFVSRLASIDVERNFIPGSYTEVRDVNVPSDQQKTKVRCEAANFTKGIWRSQAVPLHG